MGDRFPIAKEDWLQPPGESKLQVKGKLQECLDPSVMCGMGVGGFALCLRVRGMALPDGFEEE